jgi:hypothetical protein
MLTDAWYIERDIDGDLLWWKNASFMNDLSGFLKGRGTASVPATD